MPDVSVPAAVCENVNIFDGAIVDFPDITAETEVSAVRDQAGTLRSAIDKMVDVAADFDVPGAAAIKTALDTLDTLLGGLGDGPLGDAAEDVSAAYGEVKSAGESMVSGLDCQ